MFWEGNTNFKNKIKIENSINIPNNKILIYDQEQRLIMKNIILGIYSKRNKLECTEYHGDEEKKYYI